MTLNEQQIRQIVQDEIQKNTNRNVFRLSPIPVHAQTGTDSSRVDPTDLINSTLYYAVRQTTITKAQILKLHTTPITLVPAIGQTATATNSNTVLIVEGITAKLYFGGTAYAGANNLEFRYTNASGAKVTADLPNTFINSAANAYAHVAGVTTALTPVVNSPIVVTVPVADPTTGTGYMVVTVKYRVITL